MCQTKTRIEDYYEVIRDRLTFRIPSDIGLVTEALDTATEFVKKYGFPETAAPILVLRELLVNAITHGNKNDLQKRVIARFQYLGGNTFRIAVEDEGEGFFLSISRRRHTWRNVSESGTGYKLINRLSEHITFEKNGARVIAHVTVSAEDILKPIIRSSSG
ncbi:ATP-binding protein [Candidatus Hydrogenedentota bacterium]